MLTPCDVCLLGPNLLLYMREGGINDPKEYEVTQTADTHITHNYTDEKKLLHRRRVCKSNDSPAKHVFLYIKPLLPAAGLAAGNNGST
jgi:hypothetical protein